MGRTTYWRIGIGAGSLAAIYLLFFSNFFALEYSKADFDGTATTTKKVASDPVPKQLDLAAYNKRLLSVANLGTTTSSTTPKLWPTKTAVPNVGAILPFKRIIAYYGNFYSTKMGVLGEYPPEVMKQKLRAEMDRWQAADPATPVVPAIDYIVITAQGSPGADGKYRFRMPDSEIQKAITLADEMHGIVILEMQVGVSTLRTELPLLEPYLKRPEVHLALDPEFSMKSGAKPGTEIGTFDAADINYAAQYLAGLVQKNNLPPKVLVVHRFTERMVTNYALIKPLPEVQVVMDMDGWGSPAKKLNTYRVFVQNQPVQFTGFKLFYKNDLKPPSTRLLTPAELLKLSPQPLFIQYQ